ncbi:MAG: hypothetical protein WA961_04550 [Rhodanobacter sp.]
MIEDILLPVPSKLIRLAGADLGQLIISPEGDLAITALWEGQEPESHHGVYVPLVGEHAFRVQWRETRLNRDLSVLHLDDCKLQVRVAGLSNARVGFATNDEPALALGGLFVGSEGLRVVAESSGDAISLDLGRGRFAQINNGQRCLAAREWNLILMRGQVQCFSTNISAKASTAP